MLQISILKTNPFSGLKMMYLGIFLDACGFTTVIQSGSSEWKCMSLYKGGWSVCVRCLPVTSPHPSLTDITNQSKHYFLWSPNKALGLFLEQVSRQPLPIESNWNTKWIDMSLLLLKSSVICKSFKCDLKDRLILFKVNTLVQSHCLKNFYDVRVDPMEEWGWTHCPGTRETPVQCVLLAISYILLS